MKNADGSIKFDDRKLRYSGVDADVKSIIYVAPSHYGEMQSSEISALDDVAFFEKLKNKGISEFNDPNAYFACLFGTNALPKTSDGYVHVFKRDSKTKFYPDTYSLPGGMFDTPENLFDFENPGEKFIADAAACIKREFVEELGTPAAFELMGLAFEFPGTADMTYVANIPCKSNDLPKYLSMAKDREDQGHVTLTSKQEVANFLETEKNIRPMGRICLNNYLESYKK